MINTINWQIETLDSRNHMGAYSKSNLFPQGQPEGFPKSPVVLGRQWWYYSTDLLVPQTTSKGCHLQTVIAIQKKIQINFIKNKDQFKKIISPELFGQMVISKKKIENRDPWFLEGNNIIKNHESLVWSKGKNAMDMYVFIIGNRDALYKLHLEIWNKIELESRFYNQYWVGLQYPTNLELMVVFFNQFEPF